MTARRRPGVTRPPGAGVPADEWRPSMTQSADQTTTVQTDVLVIGWGTADKTLAG